MNINTPHVIKTISEMRQLQKSLQGSVGFIPTMGYLHEGHVSLVDLARRENDHVIVSIFVNPKQFNEKKDYQTYPQDIPRDIQLLQNAGVDYVFLPGVEELYPEGYETYVSVGGISTKLEGKSRPGHFDGVTTVVAKLFNIIQPTRSYFGQKDAQQVAVVKKMVVDLNLPIEIIVGKTIREKDGLAMSSRNVFLSDSERKQAPILYQSLCMAQELFMTGETSSKTIINKMQNLINTTSGKIDYISIADPQTLDEIDTIKQEALVSLAVRFEKARLIDNIFLEK